MRANAKAVILSLLLAAVIAAVYACGAQGFEPQSKIDSVRMLAVKADKPYAKPGETVTMEALIVVRRRVQNKPMRLFWIPVVCINPRDDLYYLCFAAQVGDAGPRLLPAGPLADASAPEAGAGGGSLLSRIPVGVDLSPYLPQGNTFSFTMPTDIVMPREGSDPYGLAIVFNILCAGKVILAERDPNGGPQQVPLQCVDDDNVKVPPSDYVIGISRVYSYGDRPNANPVIDKVTFDGVDVDASAGVTVDHCVADKRQNCPEKKIGVEVPESSWEDNPSDTSPGSAVKEQVWVDYYVDIGDVDDEARLLYDTHKGKVSESEDKYRAPYDPVDGTLWAVVHDNRGGASWVVIPLHVK